MIDHPSMGPVPAFGSVYNTGRPPLRCRWEGDGEVHTLVERAGFVLCVPCDLVAEMPAPKAAT